MTLPTVSAGEKEIARFLETRFGGRPKFFIHRETPDDTLHIAVAEKLDFPGVGLTTCATNGISNYPLYKDGDEYTKTKLELVGTCLQNQAGDYRELLFYAGLIVVKQKWFCAPGTFLQDAVSRFGNFGDMRHLYFTTPFAQEGFETSLFTDRKVSWLTAIPVSTREVEYAREKSTDALEDLFESSDFAWENLSRKSLV